MTKNSQNFAKILRKTQKSQKRPTSTKNPEKKIPKNRKKRGKVKKERKFEEFAQKPQNFEISRNFKVFPKNAYPNERTKTKKIAKNFTFFRWGRRFLEIFQISVKKALYLQGFFRDFWPKIAKNREKTKKRLPQRKTRFCKNFAKICDFCKRRECVAFAT